MKHSLQSFKKNDDIKKQYFQKRVYIWSDELQLWWKDKNQNLTKNILEAGVFDFEDAWILSSHFSNDKKIYYIEYKEPNISNILSDYTVWTNQTWFSSDSDNPIVDPKLLTEKDYTIMSLGLGEEFCEILDVFNNQLEFKEGFHNNFKKEMGDFIYYWSRICISFDLNISDMTMDINPNLSNNNKDDKIHNTLLTFGSHIGKALGVLKKRTRDNYFSKETLHNHMNNTLNQWLELCDTMNVKPQEILELNKFKILDRKKRGTLRGFGDNR